MTRTTVPHDMNPFFGSGERVNSCQVEDILLIMGGCARSVASAIHIDTSSINYKHSNK